MKRLEFYVHRFFRYLLLELYYRLLLPSHALIFVKSIFLARCSLSYPKNYGKTTQSRHLTGQLKIVFVPYCRRPRMTEAWRLFSLVRFLFCGEQSLWSFETHATHLSQKRSNIWGKKWNNKEKRITDHLNFHTGNLKSRWAYYK